MEITLGHVFIATAAVELVFALYAGSLLMRLDPETPREKLIGIRVILAAALISAFLLCLLAFFLPEARMRLV